MTENGRLLSDRCMRRPPGFATTLTLFGHLQGIVDLDTEVSHRALGAWALCEPTAVPQWHGSLREPLLGANVAELKV